jgi:hypothetical protein
MSARFSPCSEPKGTGSLFSMSVIGVALLLSAATAHAAEPSPAETEKPPPECASTKNANECADILKKLGKNPFAAFVYAYVTPAPPCKNGAAACAPPANTEAGIIPPQRNPIAGLLYDWQTLITGGLAIVAAIIGAWAAYYVGRAQLAAAKQKDRLQAHCLAVGIFPELLELEVRHRRATDIINQEFPKIKIIGVQTTEKIVSLTLMAQIEMPPLLSRTLDQLYILEKPGPTLLQLISVI